MGSTDSTDPPPAVTQPHDGLFKLVLGKPHHAASELRSILPPELVARLDFDRMEKVDGSFIDPSLRQQHTDVMYRTWLDGHDALVYVVIEHQSRPDRWMALRMLGYLVRIWEQHLRRHRGAQRLPVIIPVVVYQGQERWWPPTDFTELFTVDGALGELVPKFSFLLDDLSTMDVAQLRDRALTAVVRLMFVVMKQAPDNEHLTIVLRDWWDHLVELMDDADRVEILAALLTYAHTVSRTPVTELTTFIARLGPEAEEVAMTTAEKLRAEGRAEGELKGRAEVLLDLLAMKFPQVPAAIRETVRGASMPQLDLWTQRILSATTLAEIFG